jgi:hypothetical protein
MRFQPGNPGPGRPRGAKNKIAVSFLEALQRDFEEGGAAAIKLCRLEDPTRYVAIIASLMPKELAVEHTRFGELSDEQLDALMQHVQEFRAKLIESKPTEVLTNGQERHRAITR